MKLMFAAVALAALIPAAAQAQESRTEERVIVMGGPGGHMEIGEDGLTREAFTARHNEMFDHMDADHDGVVSREEMAAMHGMMRARHGEGHGPGMAMFTGENGEQIVLNGDGEWTSEDGSRRIIVRRNGPDGAPMSVEGETINIEGAPSDGERRIVIRRRGPDGETVDVHEGPGDEHMMIGGHGGEDGQRHVMIFRHDSEGGLDADGDGRWSFEEMAAPLREHFNQLDANHDGYVDESERRH